MVCHIVVGAVFGPLSALLLLTNAHPRTRAASYPAPPTGSASGSGASGRRAGGVGGGGGAGGGRLVKNALAASNDGWGASAEVLSCQGLQRGRGVREGVDHVLQDQQQRRLIVLQRHEHAHQEDRPSVTSNRHHRQLQRHRQEHCQHRQQHRQLAVPLRWSSLSVSAAQHAHTLCWHMMRRPTR